MCHTHELGKLASLDKTSTLGSSRMALEELDNMQWGNITRVNISSAIMSTLYVKPVPWEPSQPSDLRNILRPLSTFHSFCRQIFSSRHHGKFQIMTCSRPSIVTNPPCSHRSEWAPSSFAMRNHVIHPCYSALQNKPRPYIYFLSYRSR